MLVNNLEVSGGYQKLVIRLAETLMNMKHDVVVYSPVVDKKKCYPESINNLPIVTIENGSNKSLVVRFKELVSKIDPNTEGLIIHDELSLIGVAALPKTNIKKIVWMLNNQLPDNLGSYKRELLPILQTKYSSKKDKRTDVRNNALRVRLMRKGLKKVSNFAVYDHINGDLVKKNLGRKADFVAAGADLEQFTPLSANRNYRHNKAYSVLSVGVLFPHRRYEDLIHDVAIARKDGSPLTATIVGRQDLSPDYYQMLVALAKSLKVEKYIRFINYVSDSEMLNLYSKSDAFIFINDGFTWGISVFEAIAAGLPVVITSNIGAADIIKNRETGWIVNPQKPAEVAKAIKEIVDNPQATKKIALTAQKELSEFVSWPAYTKRMLSLLSS